MSGNAARLVIAGLSGDGGKTITTLGVVRALRDRGLSVSTFKKGPDYIDSAWLGRVGGTACRNLDTYLVDPHCVLESFVAHSAESDVAVVEGNRGMFDGWDVRGTHSTAELAKLLCAPVVLVVDARKVTRTAAALVKGCVDFDPDVRIAGVVLNRVAGDRHGRILAESVEDYAGVPIVGTVPDLGNRGTLIPGRHLGLVPPSEFDAGTRLEATLRQVAAHLDIDAMLGIAAEAGPLAVRCRRPQAAKPPRVRIGYFKDSAFTFYYPENLEALEAAGTRLVEISSLSDPILPEIDALYIGGGFPETHALRLSSNRSMMESVRSAAVGGMPIYAECGGLIYLARSLDQGGTRVLMAGVFPVDLELHDRPVGHGYTVVQVDRPNAFYPVGTTIRGHEFHYSGVSGEHPDVKTCMKVDRGRGLMEQRDGLLFRNTLACYTHLLAESVPVWAESFVGRALEYFHRRCPENGGVSIKVERQVTWSK
jgi:cobyrinic acid a,c-diamide synthase